MSDVASQRRESFLRWMRAERLNANRLYKETGLPKMTVSDYVTGKTASLRGEAEAIIASYYGYSVDAIFGANDPDIRDPSFVTAWRELRGRSIEWLADKIGTNIEIMEMIEIGQLPLTGKRKIAVAEALKVNQGLLTMDPGAAENSLYVAVSDVPERRHDSARRVLTALTGTDD